MALGDILSCRIRPDGWSCDVTIDGSGMAAGATYDFGSLGTYPSDTSAPKFTLNVVSEGYSTDGISNVTLGTVTRTVYGTAVCRVPENTVTIAGSFVSGSFVDLEIITQAVSGATAIVVGDQSAGATLRAKVVTGTPDASNNWTGAAATFTPTATPAAVVAGTPDELDTGTTLVVRVALSESVYNDDRNGGAGTSGTDPTVTIAAGWCTSGGTPSNAASALACTNNSTLDYPKVISQWAWGHTPAWRRVESANYTIGAIAYHGHGIACVKLSALGQTSAVSTVGIKQVKANHATLSLLCYESYDILVDNSVYTQGEAVTLNYIAYPTVGDADSIIDTSVNTTSTDDITGKTQITCHCNKTGALKTFAIIDPVAGNDTTGANSAVQATAETTPYLTIGKALASGADWLYVRAGGTPDILGSTPASVAAKAYFIEVAPYPGDSVTLTRLGTWKAYKATKLMYRGLSMTCDIGTGYLDGNSVAGAKLWFDTCSFANSTNPSTGLGWRSEGCWFVNHTQTAGREHMGSQAAYRFAYSVLGGVFQAGQAISAHAAVIATRISGGTADTQRINEMDAATNPAPITSNVLVVNNFAVGSIISTTNILRFADINNLDGVAIIGNIIETKSGSDAAVWLGGDGSARTINNMIVAHNTVVGNRCNLFYDDGNAGSTPIWRTNVFCRNNAFQSFNIKTDRFLNPTYGKSGIRIGNWAQVYGVNFSDNRYDGAAANDFDGDYFGINVAYVNGQDSTFGQLGYAADASNDGTAAGNGNYLPAIGSVLKDHSLRVKYQSFDLEGVALN